MKLKKFFANLVFVISLLLIALVAIPWNNLSLWWNLSVPILSDNENYIKAGIGALMMIFGLIFLLVANKEKNETGAVTKMTAQASILPMLMYAVAAALYATTVLFFIYVLDKTLVNLLFVIAGGVVIVNFVGFGHMLISGYKKQSNAGRVMMFVFLVELMLVSAGAGYYVKTFMISASDYSGMYTFYFAADLIVAIILWIVHAIIIKNKTARMSEEKMMESELDGIKLAKPTMQETVKTEPVFKPKKAKGKGPELQEEKNRVVVPKEQAIVSGAKDIDPTNVLMEEVAVDPEFSKTANQQKQVSSIDYYIEKPKMFKPLDPNFDKLVEYVREMPQVVTVVADEKITFYVDRNPFLVLINYGNYYRMAFKHELEKGIRLIIKYPTISKNKSTKDDLWFKVNNYGDLPSDVIYQIVKASYDCANA